LGAGEVVAGMGALEEGVPLEAAGEVVEEVEDGVAGAVRRGGLFLSRPSSSATFVKICRSRPVEAIGPNRIWKLYYAMQRTPGGRPGEPATKLLHAGCRSSHLALSRRTFTAG
jgi:hypothetical protein